MGKVKGRTALYDMDNVVCLLDSFFPYPWQPHHKRTNMFVKVLSSQFNFFISGAQACFTKLSGQK